MFYKNNTKIVTVHTAKRCLTPAHKHPQSKASQNKGVFSRCLNADSEDACLSWAREQGNPGDSEVYWRQPGQ